MAKPDPTNDKSRLTRCLESSWFWAIVCLLFILLPIAWQWMESGNPNPLATLRRIFSGGIDWQAWWGFGTFLVAVVAAVIALRGYLSNLEQNRQQQYQLFKADIDASHERLDRERRSDQDRRERNRPFVQVSYMVKDLGLFVSVKNIGKTVASDVSVSFDPKLEVPDGVPELEMAKVYFEKGLLNRSISAIAPGERFLFLLMTVNEARHFSDEHRIPSRTKASASYKGYDGYQYEEDYTLDVEDWKYSMQDLSDNEVMQHGLKDINKTLQEEVKLLEKIKSN